MDVRQIIKKNKWLIALFVIALIIRIIFVFSSPVKWWDETVYANLGYDLSINPLDYSVENNGWSDWIPSVGDNFYAWPKMGFRAPLLPYLLSVFYFLNLDFLVNLFIPLIGALSVILIYILGKKLFSERIGFFSAIFLSLIPLHVIYSGKIMTDVFFTFFILLTFISFWKGYEERSRKYKVLFGLFLALTLLSRYTTLWIIPVFFIYLLVRDKSLKFLKDKYLWYAVGIFFLILAPWFVYGYLTYGNPLGAFIHGFKASAYWGGVQPWYFFFTYWLQMFSITGIIFVFGLAYIFYKKEFVRKQMLLILMWFLLFLAMIVIMPHKEDRFILAITPTLCLISGFFIDKMKKYKRIVLSIIILICLFSLFLSFIIAYNNSYNKRNECFLNANKFLTNSDKNSLVITDESSVVYYYTKRETHFYPTLLNSDSVKNLAKTSYGNRTAYLFFINSDIPVDDKEGIKIREDLDFNFEKVFECDNRTYLYKVQ